MIEDLTTTARTRTPQKTEYLTVSQAIVRFLAAQRVTRDGAEPHPFFAGAFGIFGHGNLAGLGQALLQYRHEFRYYQARNEQSMVHAATGYAKMATAWRRWPARPRSGPARPTWSRAPRSATVNRLPVLLLPSDIFARRLVAPVLQQIESPWSQDASANDAFKSVSRYWDRINRPEQLDRRAVRGDARAHQPRRHRARSRSRCRRTCRPRRRTGRSSSSRSASGRSRGRGRTGARSSGPSRRSRPPSARSSSPAAASSTPRPTEALRALRRGHRASRWARPRPARARCDFDHPLCARRARRERLGVRQPRWPTRPIS